MEIFEYSNSLGFGFFWIHSDLRYNINLQTCTQYEVNYGAERVCQRPKKSKLSGWQTLTRKNFPDEARKSFLRQLRQKSA